MLRMELLSSVMIRALIISFGYFWALYLAYKLTPSKRSMIDGVLIVGLMLIMSTRVDWILLKMMSYFILGYVLLVWNHKKNPYGALLFSLVLVLMVSVSDLISLNILALDQRLINAVLFQEENMYGLLAVLIPSLTVMVMYILSGLIVGKTLDTDISRSKVTYVVFSVFYVFLLIQTSLILHHIVVHISPEVALRDVYRFIGYVYIPLILIVAYSFYYLYNILHWEKLIKSREEELVQAEYKRRGGYRANHNVDSIILTVHTLAKKQRFDELKRYLEKL